MEPDLHQDSSLKISQLLHNVVDKMLEGFQIISRDWRYLYVNETVEKQGKKSKKEFLGRTMMECYPGIDKTPLFVQLTKCMTERVSIQMENEFTFTDGAKGWFELFIHPCEQGILIFSVDITKRKQAENDLYGKINEVNTLIQSAVSREVRMGELKQSIEKLQELIQNLKSQGVSP